ncbi:hypothetical protein [Nocardia aurantia]|uniref:Ribosomal protein L7/L12 C-terminal domain-containing protein n=1 Tax=Nocardia aurantia TaxID=2585199 RepID=A0A7K0DW53_9NOCA|nr:hypothetical protein [Nocardia aurantia]MQY30013.1 hypothetical protein [Nocardia aurantia]
MFANERQDRRLDRIERKLDAILAHLGIAEIDTEHVDAEYRPPRPLPVEFAGGMAEVDELLAQGKKIHAIKRYRELHPRASLREAKDAVEAREPRIR